MSTSKGRNAPRSKKGCTNCLIRKIKCDEHRPNCTRCFKAGIICSWDQTIRVAVQRNRRINQDFADYKSISVPNTPSVADDLDSTTLSQLWPSSPFSTNAIAGPVVDADVEQAWEDFQHSQYARSGSCSSTELDGYPSGDLEQLRFQSPDYGESTLPTPAIPRTLSSSHIPCSNSLLLSAQDWTHLQRFRSSSIVYILGKSYRWSNFQHLCRDRASQDSMVMQGVLAISASDLYRQRHGFATHQSANQDPGHHHYNLALRNLSTAINDLPTSLSSVESTIGVLWLLVMYEWKFGASVHSLRMHIEGVCSYVETYLRTRLELARQNADVDGRGQRGEFTPFCAQLLLWIAYIDASCVRGLRTFRLMEFLHTTGCRELQINRLFAFARSSYRWIHGDHYPMEEVQDDLENYRPLEMIHYDYIFRYRLCRAARSISTGEAPSESARDIWDDLVDFKEKYSEMFTEQVKELYRGRRVLRTLREGLAGYYSNVLMHHRLLQPSRPPSQVHHAALAQLFELTLASYKEDRRNLSFGWPWYLFVAAIATEDPIHREWIHEKLIELKTMGSPFDWVQAALESLDLDGQHPRTRPEDLLQVLFQAI